MKVAALMLLAVSAFAQVNVQATPESAQATRALGLKNVGMWHVFACNVGPAAATVAPERIYMALPELWPMDPALVTATIIRAHGSDKRVKIAHYLEVAAGVASLVMASGQVTASKTVIGAVVLGSLASGQVAAQLEGSAPGLAKLTAGMLVEPIALEPGHCATRTVFSGVWKGARTLRGVVQ